MTTATTYPVDDPIYMAGFEAGQSDGSTAAGYDPAVLLGDGEDMDCWLAGYDAGYRQGSAPGS